VTVGGRLGAVGERNFRLLVLGPYIAKHDMGGTTAWATVVTGEAVGSLAGGVVGVKLRPRRAMVVIGAIFAVEKLSRVSADNWMGAMAFLPMGYALAGPAADLIGMSTYLWIGAVWVVVTTLAVISVRGVREFRLALREAAPEPAVALGT
jgi:uncharacterized membrane protein YccC